MKTIATSAVNSAARSSSHRAAKVTCVDSLEPRRMLWAAYQPSVYEQYLIELVNRARANPAAEAARLGIALNEGVGQGSTIAGSAKQPLAMNTNLNAAARDHSNWLLANSLFQHTGASGSTPQQRMAGSGYAFDGGYASAENLGLTLGSSVGDLTQRIETIYRNLFVDAGVSGRGHRTTIENGALAEIGVGLATGAYNYNGSAWTGIIATQDFATRGGNPFLTGVLYSDTNRVDNFYTPGEGLGDVTVTAVNSSGTRFSTTTGASGGYSLQLPAGTYTITADSASIGQAIARDVVIGGQNAKLDFTRPQFAFDAPLPPLPEPTPEPAPTNFATLNGAGLLIVSGFAGDNVITVTHVGTNFVVQVGRGTQTFAASSVRSMYIYTFGGNDSITLGLDTAAAIVTAGAGNDTIIGSSFDDKLNGEDGNDLITGNAGNDTLQGGNGSDEIVGGTGNDSIKGDAGDDRISGSGGNDRLFGNDGNDRLFGEDGADYIDGGGNVDRLYGGVGNDTLVGGGSNDYLYGNDGHDVMSGNAGTDFFDGGGGRNSVRDWASAEQVLNATK